MQKFFTKMKNKASHIQTNVVEGVGFGGQYDETDFKYLFFFPIRLPMNTN